MKGVIYVDFIDHRSSFIDQLPPVQHDQVRGPGLVYAVAGEDVFAVAAEKPRQRGGTMTGLQWVALRERGRGASLRRRDRQPFIVVQPEAEAMLGRVPPPALDCDGALRRRAPDRDGDVKVAADEQAEVVIE